MCEKAEEGVWTLVSPSGREFKGDCPMQAVHKERSKAGIVQEFIEMLSKAVERAEEEQAMSHELHDRAMAAADEVRKLDHPAALKAAAMLRTLAQENNGLCDAVFASTKKHKTLVQEHLDMREQVSDLNVQLAELSGLNDAKIALASTGLPAKG